MCGFAGVIGDYRPISKSKKKKLDETLFHRGESSNGSFETDKFFIHCRRLAIRDLGFESNQPYFYLNKRFLIAYNGELYNYKYIKSKIINLGLSLKTNCDTELILKFLVHFGYQSINELDGMFSVIIYDRKNKKIFLSRDRYGVKPLYFCKIKNSLFFSSEIKSLLVLIGKSNLDESKLINYLVFQNFFKSNTIFKNIDIAEPGFSYEIKYKKNDLQIYKNKYWDLKISNINYKKDNLETFYDFSNKLKKGIENNLVADESIGCFLSGGLDSSTIAYFASKKIKNLNTFTVGYDRKYNDHGIFDERAIAESIANNLGSNHYETLLNPKNVINIFDDLVYAIEEPRVGMSYPNFMSYQLASKFNKVILSGAGGDEILGGYPWRYLVSNNSNIDIFKKELFKKWQKVYNLNELTKLTGKKLSYLKDNSFSEFCSVFDEIDKDYFKKNFNFSDCFNLSLYFEFKTFLHGLLVIEDKISMKHKVENRVPLLSNDLVDLSFRLPIKMKLSNFNEKIDENNLTKKRSHFLNFNNNEGKNILRRLSKKIYGNKIYKLNKIGFSSPDSEWFRSELKDFIYDRIIKNKNSKLFNYIDYKFAKKIINQHEKKYKNNRLKIWSLLFLESFMRQYL